MPLSKTKTEVVLSQAEPSPSEELPDDRTLEVGQWYWVRADHPSDDTDEGNHWLGCVVRVGSNYVKLEGVRYSARVHFDNFDKRCRFEPDPDSYIDKRVREHQKEVRRLMGDIRELTARLGVAPSPELPVGGETMALAKVEQGRDFKTYSKDLAKAKKETLPDLFRKIERENEAMAEWMKARTIPLKAQARGLEGVIGKIEDRIFSVELYAGLCEEVVRVAKGKPAGLSEKVRLLQRRHYMDEECLAQYKAGGMEFKDIRAFDRWLCRKDNRDRLLPFPRCVVAFQVRRREKEREAVSLRDFIRVMELRDLDKATFLYIRNGAQVFRMQTGIDFGEKLFPDLDRAKLDSGKLWAKRDMSRISAIITDDQYQGMREDRERRHQEFLERERAYEEALRSPEAKARAREKGYDKPDASCVDVPWPGHDPAEFDRFDEWHPYSQDSVYYDDITAKIKDDIKSHNRIALILQGLLDRSPVFHPHPPWQIWTDDGFRSALELVYDEDRALPAGEAPDFEAYRRRLNGSLREGSVTVGQQDAWLLDEGAKETKRRMSDYRYKGDWYPERHAPFGNPGPGDVARVVKFKARSGECTFAWNRERQNDGPGGRYGDPIRTTFSCGSGVLLNADAYEPGDFRQFFNDPRTRADYLKWAPLLLEAEEYRAGNREVKDPPSPRTQKSSWEGRRRYRNRKLRKELMGKAVRLTREVETTDGKAYEAGSLWRITSGEGAKFTITGIRDDGSYEDPGGEWRCVRGMSAGDLEVDPEIPPNLEEDG